MNPTVSLNTKAILLLTAPLITGRDGRSDEQLLTHGEYRRFARQLRELGHVPADLLGTNSAELVTQLDSIIPADRTRRLLDRGFLVSQAIERWQARAIWVLSRADVEYPKRIKNLLKDDAPAVLYGCGQVTILDMGGLAVVGSRHVEEALIDFSEMIGRQCANATRPLISGCAQGIDRAAMRGALEAGGPVMGVLADSLERAALNRENRNWLLDEQLVLVSPYDPNAGFNVGHAMQRNKVIYALADAALVVSAEFEKGGTWAGATEQLGKYRFTPVYVRSSGEIGRGLQALARMGAQPWPNPQQPHEFLSLLRRTVSPPATQQPHFAFQSPSADFENTRVESSGVRAEIANKPSESYGSLPQESVSDWQGPAEDTPSRTDQQRTDNPAEVLIACVRDILVNFLAAPKTESEIAAVLEVSKSQVRFVAAEDDCRRSIRKEEEQACALCGQAEQPLVNSMCVKLLAMPQPDIFGSQRV